MELFGAPNGFVAATQQEHTQALTDLAKTEAQGMQQKMAQEAQMMKLMQLSGQAVQGQSDPVGQMDATAQRLMNAGYFVQGSKIAEQAEQLRSRKAQQEHLQAENQKMELDHRIKVGEDLAGLLAQATGPQEYQQAMMTFMATHPGEKVPPELATYHPGVVELLKHSTKKGLEQLKAQREDYKTEQKDREIAQKDELEAAREKARMAQIKYTQDRMDARKKLAGGKERQPPVVGEASPRMIEAAQAMLQETHPGLPADMKMGKDVIPSAAYDLASQAKALMTRNRGLSSSEAMEQVMAHMEQEGMFQDQTDPGVKVKGFNLTQDKKTSTYTRKGGSKPADEPTQALPKLAGGKIDAAKLKDGGTYSTPHGDLVWNAKKKSFTEKAKAASAVHAPTADDDEEE